jgi:hypothetical protein
MLRNQLPADELGHIRDEIRALRLREAQLRQCFTDDCDDGRFEGCDYDVVVQLHKRRVLNKSRLPAAILNNPRYFEEKSSPVVSVVARIEPRLPLGFAENQSPFGDDNFEVIERF